MAGDPILDALRVVFPQINISTLGQVAMEFKDDLDSAAEFVIDNFGKLDDSDANKSEGHQQALDGIDIHVGVDPVDYNTGLNSVPFEVAENEDCLEQSMQPLAIASTSGQARLPEESHSDSLFPISQNSLVDDEVGHLGVNQKAVHCSDHIIEGYGDEQLRCSISKKKPGTAASQNDFPLHDDGSPDSALQSCCSVCLEDVDNTIAICYPRVEMREIFDAIAQLKGRLDTQLPVDEPLELSSSNLTSSVKSATSNISWSSDRCCFLNEVACAREPWKFVAATLTGSLQGPRRRRRPLGALITAAAPPAQGPRYRKGQAASEPRRRGDAEEKPRQSLVVNSLSSEQTCGDARGSVVVKNTAAR